MPSKLAEAGLIDSSPSLAHRQARMKGNASAQVSLLPNGGNAGVLEPDDMLLSSNMGFVLTSTSDVGRIVTAALRQQRACSGEILLRDVVPIGRNLLRQFLQRRAERHAQVARATFWRLPVRVERRDAPNRPFRLLDCVCRVRRPG